MGSEVQRSYAGLDASTGAATEAWWRTLHDGQAAAAPEEAVYLGPHPLMEPLEAAAARAAVRQRGGLPGALAAEVPMQVDESPPLFLLLSCPNASALFAPCLWPCHLAPGTR